MESLASKNEAVVALEGQVGQLSSSLETALADAESKQSLTQEMEKEKSSLETQLKKLEAEHHDAASALKLVQQDVSRWHFSSLGILKII